MKPTLQSGADGPLLEQNIKRSVAISALRKIRTLVDQDSAERAFADRFVKRFIVSLAVGLALLGIVIHFFGAGSIGRPVTSAAQAVNSSTQSGKASVRIVPPAEATPRSAVTAKVGDRTPDFSVASYVQEWRNHIESYATTNYPKELSGGGLFGACVLTVTVKSNGDLEAVTVAKSSGSEKLDNVAIAIVRGAAPYPKFSEQLRARIDVIEMTRPFDFAGPKKQRGITSRSAGIQPINPPDAAR